MSVIFKIREGMQWLLRRGTLSSCAMLCLDRMYLYDWAFWSLLLNNCISLSTTGVLNAGYGPLGDLNAVCRPKDLHIVFAALSPPNLKIPHLASSAPRPPLRSRQFAGVLAGSTGRRLELGSSAEASRACYGFLASTLLFRPGTRARRSEQSRCRACVTCILETICDGMGKKACV